MKRPILAMALALAACDRDGASDPKPVASAAAPSASAAPEKPKPWFVGTWKGKVATKHHDPELPATKGGIKEWSEDERPEGVGDNAIEIHIDEAGKATVTSSGALGMLAGTGAIEEEALSVRLAPEKPSTDTFSGLLVAKKKGDSLTGSVRASSGDSTNVRRGELTLDKAKTE